ncbi:MAG: J domain-containing protein [Dehalococcoidia bacterium]|nr:J domain-containing protein [Dehalococcoidia bacterium]
MAKDFYSTLGVPRTASDKDIKTAYRKLARQYHPDVNPGNKEAEERFKEINQAYEVLSDAGKRKKYDQYGENWEHAGQFERARQSGEAGSGYDFSQFNFRGGGSGFSGGSAAGMDDIFEQIFGNTRGGRVRQRRGQDIEHPVEITLEEAFSGTGRRLSLQGEEVCVACHGTGHIQKSVCSTCRGAGAVPKLRQIEVRIPPGVRTGSKVRIAGQGGAGRGGASGDLYLAVSVLPHTGFERVEDDLQTTAGVPLTTAVLGGAVTVPTLKSRLELKIPAETQNGRVFRLSGQGMPHLGKDGRGDLLVRIHVELPQKLNTAEKELFETLRDMRGE